MPRSLSTVAALIDASVFTALMRLCEYENTACPSIFVTASLPKMNRFGTLTFVSSFIRVVYCAEPPHRRKGFAGQALQQAWPIPLCPWPFVVQIAGRVHSFTELLHGVVVRRRYRSIYCPNCWLMFCHSAICCQPPVLLRDRSNVCLITKSEPSPAQY